MLQRAGYMALACATACSVPDPDERWVNDEPADFEPSAPAALRAYSGPRCPDVIEDADAFLSADHLRSYELFLPAEPEGAGVLFLFHGWGQGARAFAARTEAETIAAEHDLIVVVPDDDAAGLGFVWGYDPNVATDDITFFDDLLTCLHEQLEVDRARVYVSGFSAGGVWASFLTMNRASYLAASMIFSGGVDQTVGSGKIMVNPYRAPAWKLPVLLTHGGPSDKVIVDFHSGTIAMASRLRADDHVAIRCPHTDGHDLPTSHASWSWPFLTRHTFGHPDSPYRDRDPSGTLPANCAWEDVP